MALVHYSERVDEPSSFGKYREHVGALRPPVGASIPPRRYASHIIMVSSILEPSSCLEEEMYDTLMEDDAKVDSMIATNESIVVYREMIVGLS
jgi:hypothetical protein